MSIFFLVHIFVFAWSQSLPHYFSFVLLIFFVFVFLELVPFSMNTKLCKIPLNIISMLNLSANLLLQTCFQEILLLGPSILFQGFSGLETILSLWDLTFVTILGISYPFPLLSRILFHFLVILLGHSLNYLLERKKGERCMAAIFFFLDFCISSLALDWKSCQSRALGWNRFVSDFCCLAPAFLKSSAILMTRPLCVTCLPLPPWMFLGSLSYPDVLKFHRCVY